MSKKITNLQYIKLLFINFTENEKKSQREMTACFAYFTVLKKVFKEILNLFEVIPSKSMKERYNYLN